MSRMQEVLIIISTYDRPGGLSMLGRLLDSLHEQEDRNFDVLILECKNFTTEIHQKGNFVEELFQLMGKHREHFTLLHMNSEKWEGVAKNVDVPFLSELTFDRYAGFRNIGLVITIALGYKYLLFLDDDGVVDDRAYIGKATENIGKEWDGKKIGGVGGYYVNDKGGYRVPIRVGDWWDLLWPKMRYMNHTYEELIESGERLKEGTILVGGNLCLSTNLAMEVPFDLWIKRGEDLDMLFNVRETSYTILFDRTLTVRHLPSSSYRCTWRVLRGDMYRFYYLREKLKMKYKGTERFREVIGSSYPYPGVFLDWYMHCIFFIDSVLQTIHYSLHMFSSFSDFVESLRNIRISLYDAAKNARGNKEKYEPFRERWKKEMKLLSGKREAYDLFHQFCDV